MRYQVLACDYDGTLAHHGHVDPATIAGLERLLASGRRLVMVTGRELPDLQTVFPRFDLFEWIVAENGALLHRPATREEKLLGPTPPEAFLQALRQRGVSPLSVGKVIVATCEPHENEVLEAIRDLGLELHVIFNKGSVMVLPTGINKATGLRAALEELKLSLHNTVGVGDAENDHAFLQACECSVAVANALPSLKESVDRVTSGHHGAGVVELIDDLIANDLDNLESRLSRHHIPLGTTKSGAEVTLPAYAPQVLIAGPSASGKSTVATGLLERLLDGKYQVCVIDPEGDYENFEGAFVLGSADRAPALEEVVRLLATPSQSVVVSLTGIPLGDRPPFFLQLLARLLQMRSEMGRPHWLMLDEAHHLMPAAWQPPNGILPEELRSVVLITVHPDMLSPLVLKRIDTVVAVGQDAEATLHQFAKATGQRVRTTSPPDLGSPSSGREERPATTSLTGERPATTSLTGERPATTSLTAATMPGEVLMWSRGSEEALHVRTLPARSAHRRHRRKYAEGALPPDRSFYFRGPEGKLNLRAQNLMLFLQLADGVDDETWEYHRRRHDYSRWFLEGIMDEVLAAEVQRIEAQPDLRPADSRAMIKAAIERDYTLPADQPAEPGGTAIA